MRFLLLWVTFVTTSAADGGVGTARRDPQEPSPSVGLFRLPAGRDQATALAGPEGFGFLSRDDEFGLMIHWILQADFRSQLEAAASHAERANILLRYAGLALTVRLYHRIRSELLVNFAQSQLNLSEAYLDVEAARWVHLKFGKFHYPVDLERITTSIFFPLADAGLPAQLLPSVDVGAQVWGRLAGGDLEWNMAVVNGSTAGATNDVDVDLAKDLTARIFARPLAWTRAAAIADLGVGFGAVVGQRRGTLIVPQLPRAQTWAGRTYLAWRNDGTAAGTVVADGLAYRLVPQITWRARMVSAYVEYLRSVDHPASRAVMIGAWSAVISAVLTGEDSVPLHYVVPRHNLDVQSAHFGAVELTGSVGGLRLENSAAAADLLSPTAAARQVRTYAAGLNWYPNLGLRVMLDVEYTQLEAVAPLATAPNELLVMSRLQLVL